MSIREFYTTRGVITLESNNQSICMTVNRMSKSVARVEIEWQVQSDEDATKFIESATLETARSECVRLAPFADVITKLDEALANANTKTTTVANSRAVRSSAYGRHKV